MAVTHLFYLYLFLCVTDDNTTVAVCFMPGDTDVPPHCIVEYG